MTPAGNLFSLSPTVYKTSLLTGITKTTMAQSQAHIGEWTHGAATLPCMWLQSHLPNQSRGVAQGRVRAGTMEDDFVNQGMKQSVSYQGTQVTEVLK